MLTINSSKNTLGASNILSNLTSNMDKLSKQMSVGKRILSASDDPAGLAIVNKVKTDYRSWGAVEQNLTAGTSLIEASNAALSSVQELLQEMKTIATSAASDNLSTEQRTGLSKTFVELQGQIDTIVNAASINDINLLNAAAIDVDLQTGINSGDTTTLAAAVSDAATLGVDAASIDLTNAAAAQSAMTAIDTAVGTVSDSQSVMGAQGRGLDISKRYAGSIMENLESTRSSVEDLDVARASAELSRLQIQQQAAVSMLGLMQSLPQSALQLMRF